MVQRVCRRTWAARGHTTYGNLANFGPPTSTTWKGQCARPSSASADNGRSLRRSSAELAWTCEVYRYLSKPE